MKFYNKNKSALEEIVTFIKAGHPHTIFECKECGEKSKKYITHKFVPKFHAACENCDYKFNIKEDERKSYRRDTKLNARIYFPENEDKLPQIIRLTNISLGGMQFSTFKSSDINEDTKYIGVQLTLDGKRTKDIDVEGKICYMHEGKRDYTFGLSFTDTHYHERALAFYLFNQ